MRIPLREDDEDFDSDDDFESDDVRGNKPRGSSTQKGKGANILSRLAHTSGAAFTDYLSGVQTPFDEPYQTFQVPFLRFLLTFYHEPKSS